MAATVLGHLGLGASDAQSLDCVADSLDRAHPSVTHRAPSALRIKPDVNNDTDFLNVVSN